MNPALVYEGGKLLLKAIKTDDAASAESSSTVDVNQYGDTPMEIKRTGGDLGYDETPVQEETPQAHIDEDPTANPMEVKEVADISATDKPQDTLPQSEPLKPLGGGFSKIFSKDPDDASESSDDFFSNFLNESENGVASPVNYSSTQATGSSAGIPSGAPAIGSKEQSTPAQPLNVPAADSFEDFFKDVLNAGDTHDSSLLKQAQEAYEDDKDIDAKELPFVDDEKAAEDVEDVVQAVENGKLDEEEAEDILQEADDDGEIEEGEIDDEEIDDEEVDDEETDDEETGDGETEEGETDFDTFVNNVEDEEADKKLKENLVKGYDEESATVDGFLRKLHGTDLNPKILDFVKRKYGNYREGKPTPLNSATGRYGVQDDSRDVARLYKDVDSVLKKHEVQPEMTASEAEAWLRQHGQWATANQVSKFLRKQKVANAKRKLYAEIAFASDEDVRDRARGIGRASKGLGARLKTARNLYEAEKAYRNGGSILNTRPSIYWPDERIDAYEKAARKVLSDPTKDMKQWGTYLKKIEDIKREKKLYEEFKGLSPIEELKKEIPEDEVDLTEAPKEEIPQEAVPPAPSPAPSINEKPQEKGEPQASPKPNPGKNAAAPETPKAEEKKGVLDTINGKLDEANDKWEKSPAKNLLDKGVKLGSIIYSLFKPKSVSASASSGETVAVNPYEDENASTTSGGMGYDEESGPVESTSSSGSAPSAGGSISNISDTDYGTHMEQPVNTRVASQAGSGSIENEPQKGATSSGSTSSSGTPVKGSVKEAFNKILAQGAAYAPSREGSSFESALGGGRVGSSGGISGGSLGKLPKEAQAKMQSEYEKIKQKVQATYKSWPKKNDLHVKEKGSVSVRTEDGKEIGVKIGTRRTVSLESVAKNAPEKLGIVEEVI